MDFVEQCHKENVVFKNALHRRVVLRELYVKVYELIEGGKEHGNHLDLVAMTNREGHWQLGPLSRRMEDYCTFKIWDKYHLSWSEWVDQPRYIVLHQLKQAMKDVEEQLMNSKRQIDEIDNMIKSGKLDPKMREQFVALAMSKK